MGALTFLSRMAKDQKPPPVLSPGANEFESLVRWLVARQTTELGDIEEDSDDDNSPEVNEVPKPVPEAVEEVSLDESLDKLPAIPPPTEQDLRCAGFNGRCNKYADTCYSFWNLATLDVSNHSLCERVTLLIRSSVDR